MDEVGELPLQTQVRLLRVLETGEFLRMGSSQVRKTNVRVVAATNLNMRQAIDDGRFREDLYYRLNTVEIRVPALRERKRKRNMITATDFFKNTDVSFRLVFLLHGFRVVQTHIYFRLYHCDFSFNSEDNRLCGYF